jgi:capsid protein
MIEIERHDIASTILNRVYAEWLEEYATRHSLTQAERAEAESHEWHFAGRGHVDPSKEASADDTRLRNKTLTHAAYYALQGKDWKREQDQWMRERIAAEVAWNKAREDAQLPPAPYPDGTPNAPQSQPVPEKSEGDDDDEADQ